jgi:hypothetical protein
MMRLACGRGFVLPAAKQKDADSDEVITPAAAPQAMATVVSVDSPDSLSSTVQLVPSHDPAREDAEARGREFGAAGREVKCGALGLRQTHVVRTGRAHGRIHDVAFVGRVVRQSHIVANLKKNDMIKKKKQIKKKTKKKPCH